MAEAFLNVTNKPQQKKRKATDSNHPKNKKYLELVPGMIPAQQSAAEYEQRIDEGHMEVIKKTYHIGGKRYLVFHGRYGQIEDIIIKEWDGEKVTNPGIKINISRFLMILHNVEVINQSIERILKGEREISKRIHLGGGFYLTCNSPYKTIGIRLWKNNASGQLYPTTEGQTLKFAEWEEFIKISNKMFSERVELFTHIPCLIQSDKEGHNKLTCTECGQIDPKPMGEVSFDIPI